MNHTSVTIKSALIGFVTATGMVFGLPLLAQSTDHSAHTATVAETPATIAYQGAMDAMMSSMAIPYSGNADADFVRGMIPHHQGAVDNARIVLQYGTDPDVRKFAEGVIAAQEAEIIWLNEWLAKNGG